MKDPMRRRTFLQSSLIGAGCLLPGMHCCPAETSSE